MALAGMTQEETNAYNRKHCKQIAEDLEAYAKGRVYRCPECGDACEMEEGEDADGSTVYHLDCGHVTEYEPEQLSLYDYFDDCLDVEFRVGSRKEYRSACIMVACGGPNIFIDTGSRAVELYWWWDRAQYPLSSDAVEAVDDWAAEYWGCL